MIGEVSKYTSWMMGLLTVGLIMRCLRDFLEAFGEPETGIKEALKKVKRRIFAAAIGITATSLISLLKGYYL